MTGVMDVKPVGYLVKQVQHLLRRVMDDTLRDLGLTTPQYAILLVLTEDPGLSGAEIARRCFVRPQTMSGILSNLKEAELIQRVHPGHGRVIKTYLTEKGREVVSAGESLVAEIEESMLSRLSSSAREEFRGHLQSCIDVLERV